MRGEGKMLWQSYINKSYMYMLQVLIVMLKWWNDDDEMKKYNIYTLYIKLQDMEFTKQFVLLLAFFQQQKELRIWKLTVL